MVVHAQKQARGSNASSQKSNNNSYQSGEKKISKFGWPIRRNKRDKAKSSNIKNSGFYDELRSATSVQTWVHPIGKAVWMPREYAPFADEGYSKNVIAYRAISLVAQSVASVSWCLHAGVSGYEKECIDHPFLRLLNQPNPRQDGASFLESVIAYRMISGNAYMLSVRPDGKNVTELYCLRPDCVKVIAGAGGMPQGYEYTVGKQVQRFAVDPVSGKSNVLHLKNFHPLNEWYGMSPMEAAAYSIDQHNQAGKWNQALLQNGAKPSGALVVKSAKDGSGGTLSDEQFTRIRQQVDEQYSGAANAGRPILLEGGLDWKEMSLSPRDMDFLDAKHSSARDIALAFGVPPQMLGIPGDNTYSNLAEARLALWEQTILPMLDQLSGAISQWLLPMVGGGERLVLSYDRDAISALAPRREALWSRLEQSDFLTVNEKRRAVGLVPINGGDVLVGDMRQARGGK